MYEYPYDKLFKDIEFTDDCFSFKTVLKLYYIDEHVLYIKM